MSSNQNCTNEVVNDEGDISQAIKGMLFDHGIKLFEPEVVANLAAFTEWYAGEIVRKSKLYMEHAGRNELNVKDIKLAVKENTDEISKCRLPFKELLTLAKEHNTTRLPPIKEQNGIVIPQDALTSCNFRAKCPVQNVPQFTISYVMDPSSQNQGMAISSPKNPTTIVRSSSAPLGLNHQRILFKPRISMGVPSGYNHDSFKKRKTE